MKIAQVIPFFAPAWSYGGPVRVCLNISTELAKRGHKVSVLTTDAYDHSKRIEKLCEVMDGVEVFRFKNVSNYLAKNFNLYLPKGFRKYFKNHVRDYDIVHLHSFYTILNAIAAKQCVRKGIPYVLHLHESPIPSKVLGKVFLKKIFNFFVGRKTLLGASKIIVLTSDEKKIVVGQYPGLAAKIVIIPNTIGTIGTKMVDKLKLRAMYGFKKHDKIILTLARLAKIKRIDLAIKAFAMIAPDDNSFKFIIAGPDERDNQKSLENLRDKLSLQNKVIFYGPVSGQEKEDIYNLSDIFVLFSQYESFSITCLEALQHNLPLCITSRIALAQDLKPFGVCKIVNSDDPKIIGKAMIETYRNRKEMSRNSRKAIVKFKSSAVISKIESIYKDVIQ